MRTVALALAFIAGAAANVAAGEPRPLSERPPFPGPAAAAPVVAPELRAYAPAAPRLHAEALHPPRGRTCFTQAETREKIVQRRLTDPVSAMRAGRSEGDALRARLCRWRQDELVYEVYVLRHDGHVVRLYMNAQSGEAVNAADIPEHR